MQDAPAEEAAPTLPLSALPETAVYAFAQASEGPSNYVVQVAAFAENANLTRAQERFRSTGFPVQTRETSFRGTPVTLLRLGPFPTEASAETALMIARAAGFSDAYLVTLNGG
jgi:cell division septation protein DedD